ATAGAGAFVLHRGDATAGAILIKVAMLDGTAVCIGQARDGNGTLVWHPVGPGGPWHAVSDDRLIAETPAPEREVDAYIRRQRSFDSDLWVIEIEDRSGRHFLPDPVLTV
nr:DUF1491 family protein [Hyphomonadaceae bacterium]